MKKRSKENILKEIKLLHKSLGRIPQTRDDRALSIAATRFFGSWKNALIELDLVLSEKKLRFLYINKYLSCQKIANKYGITRAAVIQMLKRYNIKARSTKDYAGLLPSGKNHPNWKGGRFKDSKSGYMWCYKNGKYKYEHRLVFEKHINRKLKSSEVVHHLNGIKDDNRIENLIMFTQNMHSQMHWKFVKELQARIRKLEKQLNLA